MQVDLEIHKILEKWSFNWPVLDVLIGGKSSIDLPQLFIDNFDDATKFIQNYGFNPLLEKDARRIHAVLVESLAFIETILMPHEWKKGIIPPQDVLMCTDVRQLLLWASEPVPQDKNRKHWSCAVLRVMHTIAHISSSQDIYDIQEARSQIFVNFEKKIFRKDNGSLWFGEGDKSIPIERVEWKSGKTRSSIILKLLHKPGNVAETIFDKLGVRIITKHKLDALVAVKFLRDFFLVTFPNTTPARSKNTLIDVEKFRKKLSRLTGLLAMGHITAEQFLERLKFDSKMDPLKQTNPHSSVAYKSIQLTCRQLIRYPNPTLAWKKKMLEYMDENATSIDDQQRKLVEQVIEFASYCDNCRTNSEISVFFPFEVQIFNAEMAAQIDHGAASHDVYKRSQIRAARKRVLGNIIKF